MNTPDNNQRPFADAAGKTFDVAIVGAGPAGATAALMLAQQGHKVALLDREAFPRDKVCGGGLVKDALDALDRLGLLDPVAAECQTFDHVRMFSPAGIEMKVKGDFKVIRRSVLDGIIADAAATAGATFLHADVSSVQPDTDGTAVINVKGSDKPLRAKVAVIATGYKLRLADQLNMVTDGSPSAVAICGEVKSTHVIETMTFGLCPKLKNAYAWIFPLGGGQYNVGCGTIFSRSPKDPSLQDAMTMFRETFQPFDDILSKATAQTPMRSAALRYGLSGVSPVGPGNILAVGETINATLPLSGEGIGKAMETAEIAADLIHDALTADDMTRLLGFPDLLEAKLREIYKAYRKAQSIISIPWLNDFMAKRYQKSKYVQELFAGLIKEEIPPSKLFSLRTVFWSLIK